MRIRKGVNGMAEYREAKKVSLFRILKREKSIRRVLLISWASNKIWIVVRTFLLIGFSFVLLYPLLYIITVSIRESADLMDPLAFWVPRHITATNIVDSFNAMKYPQAFMNTIILDVVSTLLQLFSCALVGYGFARFRFPLKNLVFGLVIFTIIVPPQLIIIPQYINFRYFDIFGLGSVLGLFFGKSVTLNLLDTVFTFYVPAFFGFGIRSGLFIFIFRQFFRGMSKELQESAYIDGCGQFKTFVRIMAPNAIPAFITVFLFSLIWYWNDYYYAAMFFDRIKTVSLALESLKQEFLIMAKFKNDFLDPYVLVTRLQAGCLLTIAPIFLLYLFLQKFFVESIERTGIVG